MNSKIIKENERVSRAKKRENQGVSRRHGSLLNNKKTLFYNNL